MLDWATGTNHAERLLMLASVRRGWLVLKHETGSRLSTCLPAVSQSCLPSQSLVASPTALFLPLAGKQCTCKTTRRACWLPWVIGDSAVNMNHSGFFPPRASRAIRCPLSVSGLQGSAVVRLCPGVMRARVLIPPLCTPGAGLSPSLPSGTPGGSGAGGEDEPGAPRRRLL